MINNILGRFKANQSLYEDMVVRLILEMPAGGIHIDCGAHIGTHTKHMLARQDVSGVLAIEAIPELAEKIRISLAHDSRLTVYKCALSNTIGTTEFHVATNAPGYSGIRQRDISDVEDWKKIVVDVTTLDTLTETLALNSDVALIKLDLEGGEFDALLGAQRLLTQQRPFVIFENGLEKSANNYNYSKEDFFAFFRSVDYELYDFFGNTVDENYWMKPRFTYMYIAVPREGEGRTWYLSNHERISESLVSTQSSYKQNIILLPYQEKIIAEIVKQIDVHEARVLEIGGAPPYLVATRLVELGARSVTVINYRSDLMDQDVTDTVCFKNIDARMMSKKLDETYDLIFGIAVFEHLPEIEVVLSEASSILTKTGVVALHGAAFWSSNLGHHVWVHIDGAKYEFNGNNPIDHHSHLYYDYSSMLDNLIQVKKLPEKHAVEICEYIYKKPVLNRYHYEDIVGAFSRSRYEILYLRDTNWLVPSPQILEKINEKQGHYAHIYSNYSCGELTIIARPIV